MCETDRSEMAEVETEEQAPALKDKDLENRFTYHAPKPGQPELYTAIRLALKEVAYIIKYHVPDGREQNLALNRLQGALFWATAGIEKSG